MGTQHFQTNPWSEITVEHHRGFVGEAAKVQLRRSKLQRPTAVGTMIFMGKFTVSMVKMA